jgi:cytochrome c oxidase assembly protein subunit 15
MIHDQSTPDSPRWLHALAVLTVLLTLPLLFLGAGVTSHGVGMADPRGFRWPWEILRGLFADNGFGWLLEYSHRTFGFLVGMCGIGLAVGCYFFDRRPWLRWMGLLALSMICVQGALGAFRVDYHALHGRTFALIHGIFAQIVFAVLVSIAVFTSRRLNAAGGEPIAPALERWSIVTVLVVFGQLILGGLVRHGDSLLGPRGHLLGAFVVVAAVVWLLKLMRESDSSSPLPVGGEGPGVRGGFRVQRILLMALLAVQLMLGVESWLAKFYVSGADLPQLAPMPLHAEWIRTAHYLVGTLIFSTTVVIALAAHRKPVTERTPSLALQAGNAPAPPREWEGAL